MDEMSSQAHSKLKRDIRSMPKWVSDTNDRIGPKPPAPPVINGNKIAPALPPKNKNHDVEPDYEVIEFSGQQYSNEPMITRTKTPESKIKCALCGSSNPWVTCGECAQQIFCASCDDMYHKHPKRKNHVRKAIEQNLRPPLPPKTLPGQPGSSPPIAPPRRGKRGIMTPLMQRKDQVMNLQLQAPLSPAPSHKSSTWQERDGSLNRSVNLMNRPLPDPPKSPGTPQSETGMSSRSVTPRSAFDAIQRPPSVTLEKIKSKANATLDRMAILQQRYRQQKLEQERNRSGSVSSQNLSFDQWANISPSPSNFRSGSMSSGLNSSHFDLSDDSHFNFNHQRPHTLAQQQQQMNRPRNMSSSVFNLNQINRSTPHEVRTANSWGANPPIQQAQSMAQLNCMGCNQWNRQQQPQSVHHMHMEDFNSQQQLNGSNLSLNMPAGYMLPNQHHHHGYPPPVFMNPRGGMMYPYPYAGGMPIMNPGLMGMPPTSRSRATSRAASPAMSRKSMTLRRKRNSSFAADDDVTDDEDSDQADRRSLVSNRSYLTSASRSVQRPRRMSNISQPGRYDDADGENMNYRVGRNTERRSSKAKSLQSDWVTTKRIADTYKPNKIYSDLDSEGSGTRALVQAKIQEKLEQTAKKGKSQKRSSGSESVDEKPKPIKVSTEVQAGTVRSKREPQNQVPQSSNKTLNESESEEVSVEEGSVVEEEVENENTNQAVNSTEKTEDIVEENPQESQASTAEADERSDLGPPPSTPDYEWECEFCTFVNEPNIKICTICCKTPGSTPKRHQKTTQHTPADTTLHKQKQSTAQKGETLHSSTSATKPKSITKTTKTVPTMKTITNGVSKLKVTSCENESDHNITTMKNQGSSSSSSSTLKSSPKKLVKESVEDIWTALDENIQATADEVLRKSKVSTGCGTSPPPRCSSEINDIRSTNVEHVATEIGTSPLPQSISTQTYDVLPVKKIETSIERDVLSNGSSNLMRNAQNLGHNAQFSHNTPSTNTTTSSSPWTTLDHLSHHNESVSDFFRNKDERYLSISDLRYRDADTPYMPNGIGRGQSSNAELLTLQRTQSQMLNNEPFSNFTNDIQRYEPKPARDPETELYILLKEAELYKYTPEELHAALKNCGPDTHPIQWLRDNWPKLIQTVRSLATKYGQERIENTIGTISQQEARDALRMHGGNIWQAVSECIEQRQRKYRDISSKGNFSREDIVTALTTHQGNVELALMDLGRTQLKPFLMRIWGSPGGVENESGANVLYESSKATRSETGSTIGSDQFMKTDIHEFLSANASECLQTPSISGTFMRDFHSPFSNHDLDNATANIESIQSHPSIIANYQEQAEDTYMYNKHMLKDLETLIGNIEQNQAKQKKEVLQSIEIMLEQLINKRDADQDMDPEAKRILMKSPINTPKLKTIPKNDGSLDIKAFVWQNIQEIVPSLVQKVKAELCDAEVNDKHAENSASNSTETYAIEPNKFIMKEIIEPNIKEASFREEIPPDFIYAAEIASFRMEFDRALEHLHEHDYELDNLNNAIYHKYKMFIAPIKPIEANSNDDFEEGKEALDKLEKQKSEPAVTILNEEEEPTTSKAALQRVHKSPKSDKQIKKTNIPKLQEVNQKDKETSRQQENKTAKAEDNNKKENTPEMVNQTKSTTQFKKISQKALQETVAASKTEWEKHRKISKIPIRRLSNTLTAMKSLTFAGDINDRSNITKPVDNSKTKEKPAPTSTKELISDQAENSNNSAENSMSPVPSEYSRAEELFQDLEELSSDEVHKDILELPVNNNEKDNNDINDNNDDTTSDEEELFSAGSGSAKSLPQYSEESENVEHTIAHSSDEDDSNENEFEAVSEQSKQNLSQLVQDTQRIIKQMKDEITLDEYESSDEDDYSEDYSAEYDSEEEDWDEEETDKVNEVDELDYENDDELASVFEEDEHLTDTIEQQTVEEVNLPAEEKQAKHSNTTQFQTNFSALNITNTDIKTTYLSSEIYTEQVQSIDFIVSETQNEVASNTTISETIAEARIAANLENNLPESSVETILESINREENPVSELNTLLENINNNKESLTTVLNSTITEESETIKSGIIIAGNIEEALSFEGQNSLNKNDIVEETLIDESIDTNSINVDATLNIEAATSNAGASSSIEILIGNEKDSKNTETHSTKQPESSTNAEPETNFPLETSNAGESSNTEVLATNEKDSKSIAANSSVIQPEIPTNDDFKTNISIEATNSSAGSSIELTYEKDSNNTDTNSSATLPKRPTNGKIETYIPFAVKNLATQPESPPIEVNIPLEATNADSSSGIEIPISNQNDSKTPERNSVKRASANNEVKADNGKTDSSIESNPSVTQIEAPTNGDSELNTQTTANNYGASSNIEVTSANATATINTATNSSITQPESLLNGEPEIYTQSSANVNTITNNTNLPNIGSTLTPAHVSNHTNKTASGSIETTGVTVTTEPRNDIQSTKRTSSKIPKPKEISAKHSTKKVPRRSKSFSGPPISIGISSVKAIQQQYLHKQSQIGTNFLQPKATPSAIVRKKSITEVINKLTSPAKDTISTAINNGPSTSTGLFRPRTQIRIPKKKYHETCFSDDDYETTSSEEEQLPLEVRERKQSVPVFRAYPSLQEPETLEPEELAQKFVDENLVGSIAEAHIAATLVNMKFPQDVSIWAAKECSDLDHAISMLRQECELCMGTYPMNEIVSMLKCTHKCCKQCAKSYFTVQITDRSINDCNCPFCKMPELHNQSSDHEDESLEYFSNLDIFLKNILETEVHELFQRKLRDRSLLQDPNFKWCVQCSSGFFARPKQKRLICPDCGSITCSQCRKKWEKQHEGITCDQFQAWKDANDPEIQAQGVQEHLAQNGIDCPKCKFRYSLTRGGCMHFTCTQCKFEFCYGCAKPFMMGAKCNISPYCAKLGLHAHHPRNCLFYLRDKIPLQLQFLLKENGVSFDVDPIDTGDTKSEISSSAAKPAFCPIPIQKETPTGLYDTVCNNEVPEKHAGMCRTHYVEYLTAKVAKAGIDPLPIFDLTDCVQELRRRGIALPERGPWDTDEIYKNMCSEVIRQNLPLNSS